MMQGRIDVVRPDGLIEGWGWNDESPEARLNVTVLVDGIEAGSGLAVLYREDLRMAKIGDGCHAFSFVTQSVPSSEKRSQNYTLIETETRRPIGAPLVVHNKQAIGFDNRLIELETKNRLLTSRLEELARRDAESSSPELFAVVGEFFSRLANDMKRGEPLGIDGRLEDIVANACRAHRPLVFPIPERPLLTILVHACTSLTQTHACLAALLRAGAGTMAEVVVMDSGQTSDTILLPSLVRGVHYLRTAKSLTSEWADATQAAAAESVLLLNASAIVGESFLREIVDGFAGNAKAAAIGAHAVRSQAIPLGGGLCLLDGTLRDCIESMHPEAKADVAASYPAHALSYHAAAFRRSALHAVGGLDAAFDDDLGAAVIDLCFRLRQCGWSILAHPLATVELQPALGNDSWLTRGLAGDSIAAELLRARWFDVLIPHPSLYIGHAAILGSSDTFEDDLVAIRRLREWGYSVDYLTASSLVQEDVNDLRRAGAHLLMAEDVGNALAGCGALVIYSSALASLLEHRPAGSCVFIGLSSLEQSQPSDIADVVAEPRFRQAAGS